MPIVKCVSRFWKSRKNQQEHKARIEMLEFQMAEIEAANLQAGEDLSLNQEREKLLNHKKQLRIH